jgi:hypothetical protein
MMQRALFSEASVEGERDHKPITPGAKEPLIQGPGPGAQRWPAAFSPEPRCTDSRHSCCPFLLPRPRLCIADYVCSTKNPVLQMFFRIAPAGQEHPASVPRGTQKEQSEAPRDSPPGPGLLPAGTLGLRQLGRLSPPTYEAKKDPHPDL